MTGDKPEEKNKPTKNPAAKLFGILAVAANVIIPLVIFLLCRIISIWSYWDGFYPLLWFGYLCFNI